MEVQVFMFFIININILAIVRFVVFSKFDKLKTVMGLALVNLVVVIGYDVYLNDSLSFTREEIIIVVLIAIGILFTLFYVIEKRKR